MATASDAVRYVGPGIDEALAGLLGYWSRLRSRLTGKGKGDAASAEEPATAPEESGTDQADDLAADATNPADGGRPLLS